MCVYMYYVYMDVVYICMCASHSVFVFTYERKKEAYGEKSLHLI